MFGLRAVDAETSDGNAQEDGEFTPATAVCKAVLHSNHSHVLVVLLFL